MGMRKWFFPLVFFTAVSAHSQPLHEYGWTFYNTENKCVQHNFITDIEFDAQGRAWVATSNFGLNYYDNKGWHVVKPVLPDSLVFGWFHDLAFIDDQTLAIGGIVGKLVIYHLNSNTWEYVDIPQSSLQAMEVCKVPDNGLLLGGTQGLVLYRNGSFKSLLREDAGVMGLSPHGDDAVDVSTGRSTYRYRFSKNLGVGSTRSSHVCDAALYRTAVDGKGRQWAAAFTGLNLMYRKDSGWVKADNIPQTAYYNFNGSWQFTAHELAVLTDGRLLAGSQFGAHLIVNNDNDWEVYSVPLDGEFDGINRIVVAPDSSIWLATWHHGVVVFSHKDHKKHKKIKPKPQPLPVDPRQQRPTIIPNMPIIPLWDD